MIFMFSPFSSCWLADHIVMMYEQAIQRKVWTRKSGINRKPNLFYISFATARNALAPWAFQPPKKRLDI